MAGTVWWLDRCHVLHANDARTGAPLFAYDVGSANHFATPAAAGGRVYAPTASGVAAFAVHRGATGN